MAKEVMRRKASDNKYLHKDFHGALSAAIDYLDEHYGPRAVRQYLRQFTLAFHAPLTEALKARGLVALKEYFETIYNLESGRIHTALSRDDLILEVEACPAITHMRQQGCTVARLFQETTKTLNEALCEGTDFSAELVEYDPQTGRSVQRFYRTGR